MTEQEQIRQLKRDKRILLAKIRRQKRDVARCEAIRRTFLLRAFKEWQEAHPFREWQEAHPDNGKDIYVIPNQAKLIDWLLEREAHAAHCQETPAHKWLKLYAELRERQCCCNVADISQPIGSPMNYICEWCAEHPDGNWDHVEAALQAAGLLTDSLRLSNILERHRE